MFQDAKCRHIKTDSMDSSTYSLCDDDRNVKEVVIKDTTCYYGLTLVNRSQHDLFIYVFSFDPADCSISVSHITGLSILIKCILIMRCRRGTTRRAMSFRHFPRDSSRRSDMVQASAILCVSLDRRRTSSPFSSRYSLPTNTLT